MPDYEALRGEAGGLPPDGVHDAWLDSARLVDTRNGESIVCDWRTTGDPLYQWTSWHRLGGQGLSFTLDFLDAIGVDRASLREVEGHRLEDALDARLGQTFTVRTKRWGSDGGGGVNVEVQEANATNGVDPNQTSLDAPIDTADLDLSGVTPAAPGADDDSIPF